MVEFQGIKDSNKKKAMKNIFLSFTDKIKANLKQNMVSRISNKKFDCLIFAHRYFAHKQLNNLC